MSEQLRWEHSDTMRGDEWKFGPWLVLRRRGDNNFQVLKGMEVRALGFTNADEAKIYVEDRVKEGS